MLPKAHLRGRFIVLDGPDGSGKTTVVRHLAEQLRDRGCGVTVCKDPGGTTVGDRIRGVLLNHDLHGMDAACETLLFMASRAQLVAEVVRPALARGDIVLCDRFVSATCAYQVAAGFDFDAIIALARYAIGTTWPDLTLVLDVPCEVGFARVQQRARAQAAAGTAAPALDSMESRPRSFHETVRQHFLGLPTRYPAPVALVNALPPVARIVTQVLAHVDALATPPARTRAPALLPGA
jgi:dTMP kinase